MATEDDVRAIALTLPEVTEELWYRTPAYKVAGKGFLRLRTEAEGGLVVFVPDLGEKEALLAAEPEGVLHHPALRRLPAHPGQPGRGGSRPSCAS